MFHANKYKLICSKQTKSPDLNKDVSCCDSRKHSAPRPLAETLLMPGSLFHILLLSAGSSEGPWRCHGPILASTHTGSIFFFP